MDTHAQRGGALWRHRHTKKGAARLWRQTWEGYMSQGLPATARSLEEARNDPTQGTFERAWLCPHLDFGLSPAERWGNLLRVFSAAPLVVLGSSSLGKLIHPGSHWEIWSQGRSFKGGEWHVTFSKGSLGYKMNMSKLEKARDGAGRWSRRLWEQPLGELWGRAEGSRHGQLPDTYSWHEAWRAGLGRETVLFPGMPQTWAHVFTFSTNMWSADPQLEPSSDAGVILPFHTLHCFSLNCNCFLHNEKPAPEWQSIKNPFSPLLRL